MADGPGEFSELLRELQGLQRQIGHASDKLDDVIERIRPLARRQTESPATEKPASSNFAAEAGERRNRKPLVCFLMIERQLDGRFLAQIGENEPLAIPKSLARLLAVLAGAAGDYVVAKDPFVGWKSGNR